MVSESSLGFHGIASSLPGLPKGPKDAKEALKWAAFLRKKVAALDYMLNHPDGTEAPGYLDYERLGLLHMPVQIRRNLDKGVDMRSRFSGSGAAEYCSHQSFEDPLLIVEPHTHLYRPL